MERIQRFLHANNKKVPVLVPNVVRDMVTRYFCSSYDLCSCNESLFPHAILVIPIFLRLIPFFFLLIYAMHGLMANFMLLLLLLFLKGKNRFY